MELQQALESRTPECRRPGYLKRLVQGCLGARGKRFSNPASLSVKVISPGTVVIRRGELCVIEFLERCTIECTGGTAWVTLPGRFCDYIIGAGESLGLKGEGKIIVSGDAEEVCLKVNHM